MDIEALKKQFHQRDRVVRVISKDGFFRAVAIKNTNSVATAQSRHNLDTLPAYFLGKAMTAASLMAAFLKGEERLSVEIQGSSVIKKVFAEAIQVGEVRGFVDMANTEEMPDRLDSIESAIGAGTMRVARVLYNKSEPIIGVVELVQGDVATDLAYYYRQSEQIPTAVLLDITFDEQGMVKHSGGMLVQSMPGAKLEDVVRVAEKLYELAPITSFIEAGKNPEEIIRAAVDFEFDVVKTAPVDFFCRCSKETFLKRLVTLGSDEIKAMKNEGDQEVVCQYCNEKYIIDQNDFETMLVEIQAKKN